MAQNLEKAQVLVKMIVSEIRSTLQTEPTGILEYSSLFWENLQDYNVCPAPAAELCNLFQPGEVRQHFPRIRNLLLYNHITL